MPPLKFPKAFWSNGARAVQQHAGEGAQVAIAVCPDPRPGFQMHLHLVSSLKKQHGSIRAVVCDVGGGRMFSRAHDHLAVLVQQ